MVKYSRYCEHIMDVTIKIYTFKLFRKNVSKKCKSATIDFMD